eukprot:CAMPEP_0198248720 /NCGR_PEP_ID=MMETSP1447-20131203/441_1 /TAXON_ID=420782 /ORGANISM="Chaetoceros dichaeta, Strain CCMP1751" /LENGTH=161 /DNA_ID=CAMNT_0043933197 /DNA_START=24 /DNA_END=506 /DNA_ORIENTATION=+
MKIKCIIISILGLAQGGHAEESTNQRLLQDAPSGISEDCDVFIQNLLGPSDTSALMYEEQDIVNTICNAISRDAMLEGFVRVKGSGNPCIVELMDGLTDLDLIGSITDPEKCADTIREGSDARRKMSIMSGEDTVDRDLGWWNRKMTYMSGEGTVDRDLGW